MPKKVPVKKSVVVQKKPSVAKPKEVKKKAISSAVDSSDDERVTKKLKTDQPKGKAAWDNSSDSDFVLEDTESSQRPAARTGGEFLH